MSQGSTVLDRARNELDAAKERVDGYFPEGILGYCMSQSLCMDETKWARACAKALEAWALAREQYQEAKRVATWNAERGWGPSRAARPVAQEETPE